MANQVKNTSTSTAAGWGWPGGSRVRHYFNANDTLSVCGRFYYYGSRGPRDLENNCAMCLKMNP